MGWLGESGVHLKEFSFPKGRRDGRKGLFLDWQPEFLGQWAPQHAPSADMNGANQSHWGEMVTQVT